ncbi:uncharacterized protein LOC132294228 [Cornus florida]|uniref:uncharacterized protein LOC132294228 n=1 Tax=Cornus florida TaxID=4283 RepID=UPI0028A0C525|nr:uncharacterized protein LOC132294228 [Cornus florida]
MARSAEGGNSPRVSPSSSNTNVRLRARPDALLIVCRFFSVITALAAILCIVVNVLSAIRSFTNVSDIFDGIFRCYAVVIAILVVVAETEWGFIMKFWKVLEYWVGRGMLQIFVAVMTKAYPENYEDQNALILLQSIASYILLGCGVVYVFAGILCIGLIKRSRQKKEITAEQAVRDLQELERRREELEALLIEERA